MGDARTIGPKLMVIKPKPRGTPCRPDLEETALSYLSTDEHPLNQDRLASEINDLVNPYAASSRAASSGGTYRYLLACLKTRGHLAGVPQVIPVITPTRHAPLSESARVYAIRRRVVNVVVGIWPVSKGDINQCRVHRDGGAQRRPMRLIVLAYPILTRPPPRARILNPRHRQTRACHGVAVHAGEAHHPIAFRRV